MAKKRNKKFESKNNKQSILAERTEQIFLTMPSIIVAQITKNLLIQQAQEKKLNIQLKKQEIQKKKLTQKILELKKKNTAAAKKQLNSIQKLLKKAEQFIQEVMHALQAAQKQSQILVQKKAKFLALQDQMRAFEKDWLRKMNKNAKLKTKPANKIKEKTRLVKAKAQSQVSNETQLKQAAIQTLEVMEAPVQDSQEPEQDFMEKIS